MHFWPGKTLGYESVDSNDDKDNSLNGHSQSRSRRGFSRSALFATIIIAQVLVLASSNIAAYTLGKTQSHIQFPMSSRVVQSESIGGPKVRTQPTLLEFNQTYAERPSRVTDAAWESIFPPHGGFFKDASIAPAGASLAVYHQLHCLDAIRHAYYVLLDAVQGGYNVTMSELEDYSTDWHTRHCIDFLRQMLMCNADLHIEPVDPKLGGITGFGDGREHECVVWEDVRGWSVGMQG